VVKPDNKCYFSKHCNKETWSNAVNVIESSLHWARNFPCERSAEAIKQPGISRRFQFQCQHII